MHGPRHTSADRIRVVFPTCAENMHVTMGMLARTRFRGAIKAFCGSRGTG
jgi:hypothetical protein